MLKRIIICAFLTTGLSAPAFSADVRELDLSEIRAFVESGNGVSIASVLANVASVVEGETMDVRAFNDGGLCYTVLVMQPNGLLATVFVDAETGDFISPRSDRAKEVFAYSQSSQGKNGKSQAANRSKGKGKGKGKDKGKGKK